MYTSMNVNLHGLEVKLFKAKRGSHFKIDYNRDILDLMINRLVVLALGERVR